MPKQSAVSAKRAEPSVKLSIRGASRLQARHPWVYRSDIIGANDIPPGALVRVHDSRGKFLGTALYSSSSQIAIRMISHSSVNDLPALIGERIRGAIAYRKENDLISNTDAYRVVFSEADFLPGLIVDRYNDVVTVQVLTQAMDAAPVRAAIVQTLREELQPAGIVERVEARIRELEQLPPRASGLLWGDKSASEVAMNGVRFIYDGLEGQKTGAFLDQRENYAAAAQYAHGEALDAFCYQGGFALHLARACSQVTGVDSSRPALDAAERNFELNRESLAAREIEWIEANAFDLMRDWSDSGRKFGTIVLDPPAFAKSKRALPTALRGYKELNLRALKMLEPGGILVTCSCSHHVSFEDFQTMLAEAARDAHRRIRLLEIRGQSQDHPVVAGIPETAYLKCVIAWVE